MGPLDRSGDDRGVWSGGIGRPGLDAPGNLGIGLGHPSKRPSLAGITRPLPDAAVRGRIVEAPAPGLGAGDPAGPGGDSPSRDPDPARIRSAQISRATPPEPAPRACPRRAVRPPVRTGGDAREGDLVLPAAGLVDSRSDEARPGVPRRPPGSRPLWNVGELRFVAGRPGVVGRARPRRGPALSPIEGAAGLAARDRVFAGSTGANVAEVPVRDRRADTALVALVDRDDAGLRDLGGVWPDPPRDGRVVWIDTNAPGRVRRADPNPATGRDPARA